MNFVNEHGNSAMHYACFWGFTDIAEELVDAGALVAVQNKYQVFNMELEKTALACHAALHLTALKLVLFFRKPPWTSLYLYLYLPSFPGNPLGQVQ